MVAARTRDHSSVHVVLQPFMLDRGRFQCWVVCPLTAGQFTLRDMYEQFQNIMKMGPFNQIIVSQLAPHPFRLGLPGGCLYRVFVPLVGHDPYE